MVVAKTDDILRAKVIANIRGRIRSGLYTSRETGMKPLKIYIGVDPKEMVTFHVLSHSIMARASGPVSITPLYLPNIRGLYDRPRDAGQSTEFTYSRFLTPWLAGPEVSIFMDSDMLCLSNVYDLERMAMEQPYSDVLVVKHDYKPKLEKKFLNQPQSEYPCKNWSSLMVFNGHRLAVRYLTPEYINRASPMDLHQFKWARAVGEIPAEWNHLVGEYDPRLDAKLVHYTLGAPCFRKYQHCEYAGEWFEELGRMTSCRDPDTEGSYHADLCGHPAEGSAGPPEPDGSSL